jgi:16S rRNA (cytosine967-C5)-methyltransferase
MASPSLRSLSLEALTAWDRKSNFAETAIDQAARPHNLEERDRAFLNALVLGVLRNLTLLDHHIAQLRKGKLSHKTRWILRIGLYQLLEMRVPDHAAVGETVSLAGSRGERSLVNAILRRAAREKKSLQDSVAALPLSVRYSIPEFLLDRWTKKFGETDTAELCRWISRPAPLWLRINGLRPEALDAACEAPEATVLPGDVRFLQAPSIPGEWIERGFAYIQDPSTAIACDLLAAQPGETVLDACAAPGGKACLLAEQMENKGRLVATDLDAERLPRITENFERLGITNAEVIRIDWRDFPKEFGAENRGRFDAILVDAPCSNTGVMRRRVDVRWRLAEGDFTRMPKTQLSILENVLPTLRPGGRLVYSTCSLEPEENEAVVESLLAAHPELTLEDTRERLPFRDGVDGAFTALFSLHQQP